MGDKTGIEWTATRNDDGSVTPGATWNPLRARNLETGAIGWHCELCSEGCRNCYAQQINLVRLGTRLSYTRPSRNKVETFIDEMTLTQPLRWKRPRKIFPCSMTDLFGEWHADEQIDQIFAVMALADQHIFQVLTKRAERVFRYFSTPDRKRTIAETVMGLSELLARQGKSHKARVKLDHFSACFKGDGPFRNVWVGVSAEDQKTADERIPWLLRTPAAVRFVSYEPALGPVDFRPYLSPAYQVGRGDEVLVEGRLPGLDWGIAGGESGYAARPPHPDWFRSARDEFVVAGSAFHFKQWGAWVPVRPIQGGEEASKRSVAVFPDGDYETPDCCDGTYDEDESAIGRYEMANVGKKAAGRLLDGREWDEMPEVKQ